MKTQAQIFYDFMQEQLKDPLFAGMGFDGGAILPASELARCETPEELEAMIHQVQVYLESQRN